MQNFFFHSLLTDYFIQHSFNTFAFPASHTCVHMCMCIRTHTNTHTSLCLCAPSLHFRFSCQLVTLMADYTLSRSRLAGLQLSPVAAACCLAFTLETLTQHSDHATVETVPGSAGTKQRTNGAGEFSSPEPEDFAADHHDVQVG